MFAKLALALLLVKASASPFAAKKTKNDAKARYVSKLTKNAKPTARSQLQARKLDGQDADAVPDITPYSVKFEQCQFIKSYDDEMADNEDAGTVLATKRFVVFRLCPTNSETGCNYGYGEYIVDMETYLEAYVQYAQEQQEDWCETCEENCEQEEEAEEDGGRKLQNYDCSCVDTCEKIENMEENGYIDATEFLECQDIYEDNYGNQLFAGPYCSEGKKIKIGVFLDEDCMNLDSSKDVEDYLQDGDGYAMKLSHALLKKTYDADEPVSCLVVEEEDENGNDNGDENEPEVVEMCEQLYEASAKCEDQHGFDGGAEAYAEEYMNQLDQEDIVCDYISSIKAGTYSETGDIIVSGGNSVVGGSGTSGGQKFALTIFILGSVSLAAYAAMLHSQLTSGDKADLSKQGGAMA